MNDRHSELLAILRIGHDTSMRGSGISLGDALARSRYKELRSTFGPSDLVPFIRAHASFCDVWLAYSQDKRTRAGWYLLEDGGVGRLEPKGAPEHFSSKEEAVASFVVRELDFWSSIVT